MFAGADVRIYGFEEKLGLGESVALPLGTAYIIEMSYYFAPPF